MSPLRSLLLLRLVIDSHEVVDSPDGEEGHQNEPKETSTNNQGSSLWIAVNQSPDLLEGLFIDVNNPRESARQIRILDSLRSIAGSNLLGELIDVLRSSSPLKLIVLVVESRDEPRERVDLELMEHILVRVVVNMIELDIVRVLLVLSDLFDDIPVHVVLEVLAVTAPGGGEEDEIELLSWGIPCILLKVRGCQVDDLPLVLLSRLGSGEG